ncbi:alpha/beta fold hydrolase [Roseateles violae]|uniref:Alpha/beta fold hydrolase n=1 Tax=Roseateles violae TaxID=3058042 RepID=A0ABT8DS43_9BURK|nr:alpha/beta fold hydrolase [Pelomonas sp. PFR6]MDN3918961.1 alpha/beta fold hydrolase [Pelomonas sp. PFR6]
MMVLISLLIVLALLLGALWAFTGQAVRRVEAALPPQGRFVEVPGARLHIVEQGDKTRPALLLIHGLSGNLRHFTHGMSERLAADFHVIAVDRPGAGYSIRAADALAGLPTQADAMAALIAALGLQRPVVAGHSLGGAVALALAQRHPDKVGALALIAPLTHTPSRVSPVFAGLDIGSAWLRRLVAHTIALPIAKARSEAVLGLAFAPEPVPRDFALSGGGLLTVRPSHFIGASADLVSVPQDLPTLEQGYAGMTLPVGALYGRGDRLLAPEEQGTPLIDKLPGATLELVDGGHMLPLTQPAACADFVRRVAARAAS